jgi:tRNA/rRNA methyltransferase
VAKRVVGPHEAAAASRARIATGNAVGFLFGRERTGLNNEEVSLADEILTLPVDPRFSSLNIAQAVLIVAYEWRLAAEGDALPFAAAIAEQAPREQLIAMFEHLEAALDDAGFFRPSEKRPHITLAIRAMLQRAGLTDQEVRTLRGMIAALERRPTRPRKTTTGLVTTERGKP